MSSAAVLPKPPLNLLSILVGDISSDSPTPAPNTAAFVLSPSVASDSLARSLASPAPAVTANPAPARGFIAAVPRIPPKDPKASANLRGTADAP